MTEFERIKFRVDEQKGRVERAKGQMETIEAKWDKKYGTHDVDQLADMVRESEAELVEKKKEYNSLLNEVNDILAKAESV